MLQQSQLSHEEIKYGRQGIIKIKPMMVKYNQKKINYPSEKNDGKKLEKNNLIN